MTFGSSGKPPKLSDAVLERLNELQGDEQAIVMQAIEDLTAAPEVDGIRIFDLSAMMPLMFRVILCDGFRVTFRMQDGEPLIYAITRDPR